MKKLISVIFCCCIAWKSNAQEIRFSTNQGAQPCRMKPEDIRPLISHLNPFFTDHTWDDSAKIEVARLSPERSVIIEQRACLRYHIDIQLFIAPNQIKKEANALPNELYALLNRLFFNNPEYANYKFELEKFINENFFRLGVGKLFSFPLNDMTFICLFEQGSWGGKISFEWVRFLHAEKIQMPGIEEYLDDGWHRPGQ